MPRRPPVPHHRHEPCACRPMMGGHSAQTFTDHPKPPVPRSTRPDGPKRRRKGGDRLRCKRVRTGLVSAMNGRGKYQDSLTVTCPWHRDCATCPCPPPAHTTPPNHGSRWSAAPAAATTARTTRPASARPAVRLDAPVRCRLFR